ncbi:MAG: TIGR02530 family flagellar biosynthesis protein [bacterium]
MDWDTQRIQAQLDGVGPVRPGGGATRPKSAREAGDEFRLALDRARQDGKAPDVTFSAHAAERLMQRGITLDGSDLKKISDGLDRASEKGAKDSLMLLRDLALVVSVENRTVVTALQGESARESVFTQIDSAILL